MKNLNISRSNKATNAQISAAAWDKKVSIANATISLIDNLPAELQSHPVNIRQRAAAVKALDKLMSVNPYEA